MIDFGDKNRVISTNFNWTILKFSEKFDHLLYILCPEWPHRQWVGLAFRRSHVRGSLSAASLVICSPHYTVQHVELKGYCQGTDLCRVRGAKSQLDLPSLTPLWVAGCGRLQLGGSTLGYLSRLLHVVDNWTLLW